MIVISSTKEFRIVDDLMQQIVSKTLKPGAKLPSEYTLAEKYEVPRATVRNALNKLEQRGYIYSEQGKGRFLKEESIQIELHLTGKTSFTEKMKQSEYHLTTEAITCEKISYDDKIYCLLHADRNEEVFKVARLRYIEGKPIAIHQSFVSSSNFPAIAKDGPNIRSMFTYYREHGYQEFDSNKSILSITFPTFYEQELLACNSLVPLIVVESDCIDVESNKVLEHTKILYRSDKFKYDITNI
ncbi:GntR family transcriptional regulator [Lentibacillus cibarius]|uniref:GntR family transcriptional regulator n=1 Tax=Lentibacillus cibarius TaxID=2583219 RepID=A0A5S3QL96_9BACI|nr:GntR family transcriptional regulator [Lentibacillus cibarius]TMN22630.1 GntR family transcriptional regulator [Lentibacillus cibarius]